MMRWIQLWKIIHGFYLIYHQVANLWVANGSSKRKMKVDGTIDKFKARLVIQGFRQKERIDYFDTYAHVARISIIRLLIALPATYNLVIHQMDVKTTFLNGDLEEEVYMKQPKGFIMPENEHKSDKCVYCKFDKSGNGVIICLYVDDMLIFGTDQDQVDKTKEFLSSSFSMKDMGEADVILGIRIKRKDKGITITQSHYIEKILKKFKCDDCCPVSTPLDPTIKLMPNTGRVVDQLEYSRASGCLMYAMTSTRPNIAYAVGKLSRDTSNPSTHHWHDIIRVFKYLKKTMDYGLSYVGFPSVLEGYSDASWITNSKDHTSTTGCVFLLALAAAGKEAEWLRNLIYEILLWPKLISPISIHCDSTDTLAKAYCQTYNGKYRHLGVRHSMVRKLITNGVISVDFVRSQQNMADHLTKGLARDLVHKSAIGMRLKPIKISNDETHNSLFS
ncbi:zinc finger, CCHC-type containing protein [Tanacetum coccineum]